MQEHPESSLERTLQNLVNKKNDFENLKSWTLIIKTKPQRGGIVTPPLLWETNLATHIFKKTFLIPEKIFGVDVSNTNIELWFLFVPGGSIYINNKLVDKQQFFLETNVKLTKNLYPNKKINVKVEMPKQDSTSWFVKSTLYVEALHKVMLKIETFLYTLRTLSKLKENGEIEKGEYNRVISEMEKHFDWNALRAEDAPKILIAIENVRKLLTPFNDVFRKYTFHLIGQSHIDMNWLWDWAHTLDVCNRTFSTVDRLMDKYPGFKFSQSQAAIYYAMEKHFPLLFKKIQKRVKENKWDIIASTWVEGDLNMCNGESLVRQTLYAKRYIKQKFGKSMDICWCPDTFGHPMTYPQILSKFGIKYYYCRRCGKEESPVFWWESPDKSRVLVFNDGIGVLGPYSSISPFISELMMKFRQKNGIKHYPIIYGVGDHGGGPTMCDIETGMYLDKVNAYPNAKFEKADGFFKCVENRQLPVIKDELNFTYEGCYTSHADIKFMNRRSENMLYVAETLATITDLSKTTSKRIEDAWRNTCFNQFHDILDGAAIHKSYLYSRKLFNETMGICNNIIRNCLQRLRKGIKYNGNKGVAIIVFNPLSWNRTDITEVKMNNRDANGVLVDEQGKNVSFHRKGKKIIFVSNNVPSIGYKKYYWNAVDKTKNINNSHINVKTKVNIITVENKFFTITIDKTTGCINGLYDKRCKKEFVPTGQPANMFQLFYEKPHNMSAWDIGPITKIENLINPKEVKLLEKNTVYASIRVTYKFNKSFILQDIIVYSNVPRIDFKTNVDWQEKGGYKNDAPMLKVCFPTTIVSDKACFEIPFGHIYRPVNGAEVPALKWVDLSEKNYGISLLNDSKYGHSVQGNVIRLTLLRSSYEPDPIPDIGRHNFIYSICPHKGDWRVGNTSLRSYELNIPFLTLLGDNGVYVKGGLKNERSFICVDKKNVLISALKRHEDSDGLILRIYESEGKNTIVNVKLNMDNDYGIFQEMDLEEKKPFSRQKKLIKNILTVKIRANEIKTFLIRREK